MELLDIGEKICNMMQSIVIQKDNEDDKKTDSGMMQS